jgi:hypothetical protein
MDSAALVAAEGAAAALQKINAVKNREAVQLQRIDERRQRCNADMAEAAAEAAVTHTHGVDVAVAAVAAAARRRQCVATAKEANNASMEMRRRALKARRRVQQEQRLSAGDAAAEAAAALAASQRASTKAAVTSARGLLAQAQTALAAARDSIRECDAALPLLETAKSAAVAARDFREAARVAAEAKATAARGESLSAYIGEMTATAATAAASVVVAEQEDACVAAISAAASAAANDARFVALKRHVAAVKRRLNAFDETEQRKMMREIEMSTLEHTPTLTAMPTAMTSKLDAAGEGDTGGANIVGDNKKENADVDVVSDVDDDVDGTCRDAERACLAQRLCTLKTSLKALGRDDGDDGDDGDDDDADVDADNVDEAAVDNDESGDAGGVGDDDVDVNDVGDDIDGASAAIFSGAALRAHAAVIRREVTSLTNHLVVSDGVVTACVAADDFAGMSCDVMLLTRRVILFHLRAFALFLLLFAAQQLHHLFICIFGAPPTLTQSSFHFSFHFFFTFFLLGAVAADARPLL